MGTTAAVVDRRYFVCDVSPSSCVNPPIATCSLCATNYCATHQAVTPGGHGLLVCWTCQRTYSTAASAEVPSSLASAHASWVHAGRPPQQAFSYYPDTWIGSLHSHGNFIRGLPRSLNRSFISGLGTSAHQSETVAVQTFIAGQIWGYGIKTGRGPYRTNAALSTAPSVYHPLTAPQRLQAVAVVLREKGILAGFQDLGNACKLDWIGPSFGTKYLFFVSAIPGRYPALVLDSRIAVWFNSNTRLRLDTNLWSSHQYLQYLFAMYSWATDLGESPDAVELIVFQAPKDGPSSPIRHVTETRPWLCPKCHVVLPGTGQCDNCN